MAQGLENMDEFINKLTEKIVAQLKQKGVVDKIVEEVRASITQPASADRKYKDDKGSGRGDAEI